MGDATSISWTDATWNVTRGCRRVSAGCENCYAERQANRFKGPGGAYEGLIKLVGGKARWSGATRFAAEHLTDPLRWREPRRIFVDSMSDLFYEGFTDEEIAAAVGIMVLAAQHTYQILTKRPARMRQWFARWTVEACLDVLVRLQLPDGTSVPGAREWNRPARREWYDVEGWPIPWIWLGVSVEDQAAADERIPELLATPAAVRFLSCEPLLGPVDLRSWMRCPGCGYAPADVREHLDHHLCSGPGPRLGWVIAGCESGPGARPCSVDWLRSLRDQCGAAGVPYFLKQARERPPVRGVCTSNGPITIGERSNSKGGGVIELPYLDGVQHAAFPVTA